MVSLLSVLRYLFCFFIFVHDVNATLYVPAQGVEGLALSQVRDYNRHYAAIPSSEQWYGIMLRKTRIKSDFP